MERFEQPSGNGQAAVAGELDDVLAVALFGPGYTR